MMEDKMNTGENALPSKIHISTLCSCRRRCYESISEENYRTVLKYCLSNRDRKFLDDLLISPENKTSCNNGGKTAEKSYVYHIKMSDGTSVKVCRDAFNSILRSRGRDIGKRLQHPPSDRNLNNDGYAKKANVYSSNSDRVSLDNTAGGSLDITSSSCLMKQTPRSTTMSADHKSLVTTKSLFEVLSESAIKSEPADDLYTKQNVKREIVSSCGRISSAIGASVIGNDRLSKSTNSLPSEPGEITIKSENPGEFLVQKCSSSGVGSLGAHSAFGNGERRVCTRKDTETAKTSVVSSKKWTGPLCFCKMRCYEKISENECNEIFSMFARLADKKLQDVYLIPLIDRYSPRKKTNNYNIVSRRLNSFSYSVQLMDGTNLKVCLEAFVSIYGTTKKRIRRLQRYISETENDCTSDGMEDDGAAVSDGICYEKKSDTGAGDETMDCDFESVENKDGFSESESERFRENISPSTQGSLAENCHIQRQTSDIEKDGCNGRIIPKSEVVTFEENPCRSAECGDVPSEFHGKLLESVVTDTGEVYQVFQSKCAQLDEENPLLEERTHDSPSQFTHSQNQNTRASQACQTDACLVPYVRQVKRARGLEYVNCRGRLVPARKICGPPCKCKRKCYEKISEQDCNYMSEKFLDLGDRNTQDSYISSLMQRYDPKKRTQAAVERNRRHSFNYYAKLPDKTVIKVCQEAFVAIYGGSKKRLRRLQRYCDEENDEIGN